MVPSEMPYPNLLTFISGTHNIIEGYHICFHKTCHWHQLIQLLLILYYVLYHCSRILPRINVNLTDL